MTAVSTALQSVSRIRHGQPTELPKVPEVYHMFIKFEENSRVANITHADRFCSSVVEFDSPFNKRDKMFFLRSKYSAKLSSHVFTVHVIQHAKYVL